MTYRVVVTENAKKNLRSYYLRAAEHAPQEAESWLNPALASLASSPERCSVAPENDIVTPEIRQLLVGRRPSGFRALFTIVGDQIQVLHIRRATMDTARADELVD